MKRGWVIVAITSMALIGAGAFVHTSHKNRQLAMRSVVALADLDILRAVGFERYGWMRDHLT